MGSSASSLVLQRSTQLTALSKRYPQPLATIPADVECEVYSPPKVTLPDNLTIGWIPLDTNTSKVFPSDHGVERYTPPGTAYVVCGVSDDKVTIYDKRDNQWFILTRLQALAEFKPVSKMTIPHILQHAKVQFSPDLSFQVEGLTFHPSAFKMEDSGLKMEFESDGLQTHTYEQPRKGTIEQLDAALLSNAQAMEEAKATQELSDVGALFLERERITDERERLLAQAKVKITKTHTVKISLRSGWNNVIGTWVNVSLIRTDVD